MTPLPSGTWPLCLWFVHAVPDENPPLVSDTFYLASLPLVSDAFHLASLPLVSVMPSIWPLPLVCAALWYVLPAKHRLARALTKARRACTLVCASRQNRLARALALTKARRACTLVCASRQKPVSVQPTFG